MNTENFDLVFLDLNMPGMDGAEFLGALKKIRPDLPVTIITGYPGSQLMEKALKHGPIAVMDKPFDETDIINTVNRFLKTGLGAKTIQ